MPKALFVAELDMNPGKSGTDAEAFFVEEFHPNAAELPGWTPTLHVGNHGRRPGQYLMINYFESEERARQLFPGDGSMSDEFQRWMAANPVWAGLMSYFDYDKLLNDYTEYTTLGA